MIKNKKCICIEDTSVDKIVVGNFYKYYKKDFDVMVIIYDETDKSFQELYGNRNWFFKHFKICK
ncbi:hypothetical protein [Clostridium butyricum]|uniref:hypothetical protein n=1 Tax=Clostridium butyricum TaxID=1492 RepID=UPI00325A6F54